MPDDVSAARVTAVQGMLFPPTPQAVCHRIGLNWWAALKLFEAGLLSFNPHVVASLEEDQEEELLFVGSLVAAGLDDATMTKLLAGLEKPYRYRTRCMYYSWPDREWRLLPVTKEPDRDEVFTNWLEELVEHGEIDKILELKNAILAAEVECNEELERIGEDTLTQEAQGGAAHHNGRTPGAP